VRKKEKKEFLSNFTQFMDKMERIAAAKRKLKEYQSKKPTNNDQELQYGHHLQTYESKYAAVVDENTNLNEIILHLNDAISSLQQRLDDKSNSNGNNDELLRLMQVEKVQRSTIAKLEADILKLENGRKQNEEQDLISSKKSEWGSAARDKNIKELMVEIGILKHERITNQSEIDSLKGKSANNDLKSREYLNNEAELIDKLSQLDIKYKNLDKNHILVQNEYKLSKSSFEKQNKDLQTLLQKSQERISKHSISPTESGEITEIKTRCSELLKENHDIVSQLEQVRGSVISLTNEKSKLILNLESERVKIKRLELSNGSLEFQIKDYNVKNSLKEMDGNNDIDKNGNVTTKEMKNSNNNEISLIIAPPTPETMTNENIKSSETVKSDTRLHDESKDKKLLELDTIVIDLKLKNSKLSKLLNEEEHRSILLNGY
jgi:hypothetical protein